MTETLNPSYVIYQYEDSGVYKVIRFKQSDGDFLGVKEKKEPQSNEQKLLNNLCRSKGMVLQYALCNKWDYFYTFTLDKTKYDRYDLKKFETDLSQWFRDMRKKHKASNLKFLYVPEMHKDGAWHAHGLLGGMPDSMVTEFKLEDAKTKKQRRKFQALNASGYMNIPDYAKKFGFVSIGIIKNPIATAFYISKYITKSLTSQNLDLGVHTFRASKGLKKAVKTYEFYEPNCDSLDKLLKYHGDFCSVGMVQRKDWYFGADYAEFEDVTDVFVDMDYKLPDQTIVQISVNPFLDMAYASGEQMAIEN